MSGREPLVRGFFMLVGRVFVGRVGGLVRGGRNETDRELIGELG